MTREEFLDAWASIAGKPPNPEQLAIMDHGQGPLQITAGPGVGKTYALVLRVLFLLCVSLVEPSTTGLWSAFGAASNTRRCISKRTSAWQMP